MVNRGVCVPCTEKQKSSIKKMDYFCSMHEPMQLRMPLQVLFVLTLVLILVGADNSLANECWRSPDGKEVCDKPKVGETQFSFKDGGSPENLKANNVKADYEENHGPDKDYFPQAALKAARDNEVRELKRVQNAEKESIEDRDRIEAKKLEAMEEIQKHKLEMADHKRRQETMSEDMELMKNELIMIQGQESNLSSQSKELDVKANNVSEKHTEATNRLRTSQQNLATKAENLKRKRLETEARVSKMQIEMQQFLTQIARDQSTIARAETERIQYEAQEIHVSSQLTALRERRKEISAERERATDEITILKKRLNAVKDDYNIAKIENDTLEKEVRLLTAKLNKDRVDTGTEIQSLERKILAAKDSKYKNENERSRLVAEADRMKSQLVDVQKRYEKVAADEVVSSLAVMESRVEVETAKTELSTKESGIDDLKSHGKSEREQIRNIAALAESSAMLETQQKAKVVRACKVLSRPENSSQSSGRLQKGSIIVAAPASHGFYKVLNSTGAPQYVYQTCLEVIE